MVRKIDAFQCEECYSIYESEEEAKECEKECKEDKFFKKEEKCRK